MTKASRSFKSPVSKCAVLTVFLFVVVSLPAFVGESVSAQETATAEPSAKTSQVWKGPDGEALPFDSNEEIREFLRTAEIIDIEEIPEGVTDPRRVLLEKDGIQMRAIFRDVNISKSRGPGMEGRQRLNFRDCCVFEVAAYEVAQMLGLDNVPPAVQRKVQSKNGTLQIWVEGAITEKTRLKEGISPASPWHHAMQHQTMKAFDNLVYNEDRNQGNVLYDENWKLWMIDHTRAFRLDRELPKPEEIQLCEKGLWERLQSLDESALTDRLDDLLKGSEIKALLARKNALIEHIRKLIEEKSEKRALFTYYEPRRVSR
jgi:hypothetical protein